MIITYHGLSCFKFTTKSASGQEYLLVTDPYDAKTVGLAPPKLKANIVITSNSSSVLHGSLGAVKPVKDHEPFIVSGPGEYEMFNIFIQGTAGSGMSDNGELGKNSTVFYYLEIEKIKIAFIGSITTPKLDQAHLDTLEDSDILIVPIGGGNQINAKQAATLVNQLEPRIVIPSFYKATGLKIKGLTDTPEVFFKELGLKVTEKEDKLKVTAKDLPQEELRAVWLTF